MHFPHRVYHHLVVVVNETVFENDHHHQEESPDAAYVGHLAWERPGRCGDEGGVLNCSGVLSLSWLLFC